MAVRVRFEPTEQLPLEWCVVCDETTSFWWGEGCSPLCPSCARTKSHKEMARLAKELHLGPIPTDSTEI